VKRKGIQILASLNIWTTQPWWCWASARAACLLLCPPRKGMGGTGGSHASIYYYETIYPILQRKRGDLWQEV